MGDFFRTPYVLGGVEWTLRVEIVFYLIILLLSIFKILKNPQLLFLSFIIITLFIQYIGPFPIEYSWSNGYFTFFFPFLFLGSTIFLYENKEINLMHLIIFFIYIVGYFWIYFKIFHPQTSPNFMIVGCLIFLVSWFFRENFKSNFYVIILSDLTYSIYLFHNWLWDFILKLISFLGFNFLYLNVLVLLSLLIFCFFVNKFIEKPFLKLKLKINKNFIPNN